MWVEGVYDYVCMWVGMFVCFFFVSVYGGCVYLCLFVFLFVCVCK